MSFEEVVSYLFSLLPVYQRDGSVAYKKDLSNTHALLSVLGNPHLNFKSVHIAGTNGKGTSAHAIAAVLQKSGYKTGLYTSPHLKEFTERIRINGVQVRNDFVVDFTEQIRETVEEIRPSFFEVTVAMAFKYFSDEKVDVAIVETGLGGRLDSTNVIVPEVSLITNIGLDHTHLLGDTLEKIALEKAGIIKEGVPVVLGSQQKEVKHVFEEVAAKRNAPLSCYKGEVPEELQALTYNKMLNLMGILGVIEVLKNQGWQIPDSAIRQGVQNMESITGLKGRYQVTGDQPRIVIDVAHNAEGLEELFEQVRSELKGNLFIIFGTVKEKDLNPDIPPAPEKCKTSFYRIIGSERAEQERTGK